MDLLSYLNHLLRDRQSALRPEDYVLCPDCGGGIGCDRCGSRGYIPETELSEAEWWAAEEAAALEEASWYRQFTVEGSEPNAPNPAQVGDDPDALVDDEENDPDRPFHPPPSGV